MSQSDPETTDPAPSAPYAPSALPVDAPSTTAREAPRTRTAGRHAEQTAVGVFHLDTGGCGACTQSVYALLAPRYAGALRAAGISMARSPRHADIALITGAMSRVARAAALRTLDATPYPHALVAVGDCAIDGCVFRESPLLVKDPAETLDANVEIAGCPPAPDAILAAIIEAKRLLTGDTGDTDDAERDGQTDANDREGVLTPTGGVTDGASTRTADSVDEDATDEADADDADEYDEYEEDADDTTADEPTEDETKGGRV